MRLKVRRLKSRWKKASEGEQHEGWVEREKCVWSTLKLDCWRQSNSYTVEVNLVNLGIGGTARSNILVSPVTGNGME